MKGVSYVDQLSSVHHVTNLYTVAQNLPVGARLNQFLGNLGASLGATSKAKRNLKVGYILPIQNWPTLTRSPIITSGYVNHLRNRYLMEALHALIQKNAVEKVQNQTSLAFFKQTFLGPKTRQQMETHTRSELTKQVSEIREIQNGDSREYKNFLAGR